MLFKIVILSTFAVICVSSQCEQGCKQRQYTRVKRGKYFSGPPLRFYKPPPNTYPIKGPFSYTPPPFMTEDEPSYPGRPYKVSKRPSLPSNDGLGDDDITNLVKHLSKQDLDKLLDFAQVKDQYSKYKDGYNTNEYTRPHSKRESKIVYKGNAPSKYEEPMSYKEESKFGNYVTEPTYVNYFGGQDRPGRPNRVTSEDHLPSKVTFDTQSYSPSQRIPNEPESLSPSQYVNSPVPIYFPASTHHVEEPKYVEMHAALEPIRSQPQNDVEKFTYSQVNVNSQAQAPVTSSEPDETYTNVFTAQEHANAITQSEIGNFGSIQKGPIVQSFTSSQAYGNSQGSDFPVSNNPYVTESNEEEKLPLPTNMREEDFVISYSNNVPKVVRASSYKVENFGDLPLDMDYNSKLHDVSSYHVPHYTVTQPKSSKPASQSYQSYSSPSSSSSQLKISPAAAAIKEPVYERAPSAAAAAEQSDAHLKAVKIWSHKSNGAAYTLHDDGTLTPERNRPKYG